ncbi:trypsin-like serine peptidase [Amycolatopsis sp. NPDC051758]|uniref:trypsin-like serine peptidase n=1 Tax=Amycolatopsis sp. NPDC051758 TaxID=3363935 RepID=UPI0037A6ED2C
MFQAKKTLVLAAAALAAATLGATPAQAADTVVAHDLAVSSAERQAVLDYWTPERIAAMPTGPSAPGAPPADGPDGAGFPAGTAVDRTIGRLFFVDRGEDESCTATLVAAANRSTIATAGHCVHGMDLIGNDPQWTDKVLFVPGFRDHTRPYGSFVARTAFADTTWVADDQQNDHDQAFLVLNPDEHGRRAADVTKAAQPLGIGLPGTLPAQEFGYPRAAKQPGHQGRPEFTGQRVAHCWGTPKENPGNDEVEMPRGQWGVPCDMGGGSSGGPRLTSFSPKTGYGVVVGVNTQGWYLHADGSLCLDQTPDCTRYLFGPQFTTAVTQPLYQRAAAA